MNDVIAETNEQAVSRVRASRARVALQEAPDAVSHLRELLEPGDGRTERGVEIRYERTPLLTGIADDADETYTLLVGWVVEWSKLLNVPTPTTAAVASRNFQVAHRSAGYADADVLGFKAGTTPGGARSLVLLQTMWLLNHADTIRAHDLADQYHDEVTAQVWRIRAAHGLLPARPIAEALTRPCPFGHDEVQALFFGEPMQAAEARGEFDFELATAEDRKNPRTAAGRQILDAVDGIRVECAYCKWTARPKVSEIAEWLS